MSDISIPDLKAIYKGALKHKNRCTLEIGANSGSDTQLLLRMDRGAHVHCFEPDPRAIARWRTSLKTSRATLYEVALSNENGKATFHPSGGNPGGQFASYGQWDLSGSLLPFDRHCDNAPWMEFPDPFTVKTQRLDDWAAENLSPDTVVSLAWVDVQGAEAMVIEGGRETLKRCRYWYCECDPRPNYKGQASKDQLIELLDGFTLQAEYPGYNLLFRNNSL